MKLSSLKIPLLLLAILGIAIPYGAFLPFLFENGFDISLFLQQAVGNRISLFAWADVLISAIVTIIVAFGPRLITPKQALGVALFTCAAGTSAGLPLLFYLLITNKSLIQNTAS